LLDLSERPDGVVAVTWKTSSTQLPGLVLAPRLPADCVPEGTPAASENGVGLVERFTGPLRTGTDWWAGDRHRRAPESKTDALLRIGLADGRTVQAILRPDAPSLLIPVRPTRFDVVRGLRGTMGSNTS